MAQAPQKPCDICEQAPGNFLCLQCEQVFCQICKTHHNKQKLSKNHEFQLASDGIPEVKSKCKEHYEDFSFFCTTCDVVVCAKCITGTHRGHHMSEIRDTVKELNQKLENELKPKALNLEKSSKQIIKEINRVENEASSVIQTIKEEAKRFKAMIDRHTDQLISSIKSDVDKEKSILQKIQDDINKAMSSARRLDEQKKTLDKKGPDGMLISELKSLLDTMEKLTIRPLSNAASVKYVAPTKTFQIEDVMGKYHISGPAQNQYTESRKSSDRQYKTKEKTTRRLYRCQICGHEETYPYGLFNGLFNPYCSKCNKDSMSFVKEVN